MENLIIALSDILNENLHKMVISNQKKITDTKKIRIVPFLVGKNLLFQFSYYKGAQVFHKNWGKEESLSQIEVEMSKNFKQLEVHTVNEVITALVSKKNKSTIKRRRGEGKAVENLSHNREKKYLIPEGIPVPFLVDLGIQARDGKVVDKKYHKFRQINRFLELVRDVLPALSKEQEITIIDFGCGKSYLTFAMYYYLKEVNGYQIKMIGLDLKKDVIEHCNQLRIQYGYENLEFQEGDISTYKNKGRVNMVVTLHACDTATDFALAKAIAWGADVIMSVPCCQHELNGQIHNELLQPVLKYGILKERMSALITDGLRANLLEQNGYDTQILEFIDMSHTPKNLMIRAVKNSKGKGNRTGYNDLIKELHLEPTLDKIL